MDRRKIAMTKTIVLVVEDEALIRMCAVELIEHAGHTVYEAAHSDDAIRQLEAHLDIAVVFSDIDMPGGSMDGLKLIHAVRNRWPPTILILASGRVSPSVADMPSQTIFLRKPYSEDTLLKAIAA